MKMNKYHNKKTIVNGITFDSQREALYYTYLLSLVKQNKISELRLQVKFELIPSYSINGKRKRARYYIADFTYMKDNVLQVIDVKGYRTDVYKLKKAMFEYIYKKEIQEAWNIKYM